MYRVALLPISHRDSIVIANHHVNQFPVLDIHELAAGKLSALIDRGTGRDVFDASLLFKHPEINEYEK